MEAIIAWLMAEAWPYLLGALAIIGGMLAARQSGKAAGRHEAERKQADAASEQRRKVNEADTKLVEMDDSDIRSELAEWVRDKDR